MGQHPERLGQPPLREGVGGIALVIDRKGAFEPLVQQVGIKLGHLLGQHHPLVDDRPAAQAGQVQLANALRRRRLLDPAADDIQFALKGFLVHALGIRNQNLLDLGPRRIGLFAQAVDIHRNVAPAIDVMAHAQYFGFHDGPAGLLRAEIGARQKHLAHRDQFVLARLVAGAFDLVIEKRHRDLHVNARTVPGLAIGIHRAAVPDRLQRLDAGLDHLAAFLPADRHHQADAARGMLGLLGVQAVFCHPLALGRFGTGPVFVIDGHGISPSRTNGLDFSYSARLTRCGSPAKSQPSGARSA